MPETISATENTQIIGGTFSNRDNADRAVQAFRDLGVPEQNMQVVIQLTEKQAEKAYEKALTQRGAGSVGGALHQFVVANPDTAQCDDDRRREPAALFHPSGQLPERG